MRDDAQESREDRTLVESFLASREESAFRTLYRRHTPALYPLALRVLRGNDVDAQDVVQETWIRAVEGLGAFRWESALRTWLTGILLNRCKEQFRSRVREPRAEGPGPAGEPGAPIRPAATARLDLERGLALLPEGYREVLLLHDVQGHTHVEIARLLGIEEGTSKSQLSRARRVLRASLSSDGERP